MNPSLTLKLGEHTALTLDYEHCTTAGPRTGIPSHDGEPFQTERSRFFGNPGQSHARSTVDGLSAVLDHDFGPAQLRNTFRVTHYDKVYQNVFPGSAVDAAGNMALSAYDNANQRTNLFDQTDVITGFATGPIGHKALAGVELGYQDSHNKRNTGFFGDSTSTTVSAGHPFAVATGFAPRGTVSFYVAYATRSCRRPNSSGWRPPRRTSPRRRRATTRSGRAGTCCPR